MRREKKVFMYVNFSPYVNAGKTLDFILDNFRTVVVFSFNFYPLGKNQEMSNFTIYKNGKLIKKKFLYQLNFGSQVSLLFLLLPLRSLIILIQILWYTINLKKTVGKIDLYFTVNAYSAWIGNILKRLSYVKNTIYWVWDYYPPIHKNKIVMLFRWMYWQFDRSGIQSDKIIFLNRRLLELRKSIGVWENEKKYSIVPIGTDPVKRGGKASHKNLKVVFFGVLKKSQGLGFFLENSKIINENFQGVELNVVGSGPDERYLRDLAKKNKLNTKFWGYVSNERKLIEIIQSADVGIATYIPEESNVSYYGDPSKIKTYLSLGIPVVTTNVFLFSREISSAKAGIVIKYGDSKQLVKSLKTIKSKKRDFSRHALALSRKYYYKKIYRKMFRIN